MELEFLLSSADGVIPVEVKAGNSRSRSLDRILEKDGVPYGCKLVSGNAGVTGKKRTLLQTVNCFDSLQVAILGKPPERKKSPIQESKIGDSSEGSYPQRL